MVSKRTIGLGLATILAGCVLAGCQQAEEPYKIEGPTAEGNPSIAGTASQGGADTTAGKPAKGTSDPMRANRDGR